METIRRRIEIDGFDAALNNQRQLNDAIKLFTGLLRDIPIGTRNYERYAQVVAQLQGQKRNIRDEQRKLLNETIATGQTGAGAYRRLSAELNNLRTRIKDVQASGGVVSREDITRLRELDKQLKTIDANVGQFQRNVGNYPRVLSRAGGALRSFGQAFGITASIAGFVQVLINGIQNIAAFEQALAELGSITGLDGNALDGLADRAREISLQFGTAGPDVLNAFSLIGSRNPELLESAEALAAVTEQAEILSRAAGIDLPAAGNALAGFLNVYGAEASEAARFTDILATSQQLGTARIDQLAESFKNVGPVLASANIGFEEGNALLQALAKNSIEGAEAGTALRNIILILSKTQRDELNPETQNFNDILELLSTEVTTLSDAQNLFGSESAAASLALIQQRDVVSDLNGQLNQTGNALAQANMNTDTLRGSIQRLTASWNIFFSEILNGNSGLSNFLSGTDDAVSSILNQFTRAARGEISLGTIFLEGPGSLSEAQEQVRNMERQVSALITTQELLDELYDSELDNITTAYELTGLSAEDATIQARNFITTLQDQINAQEDLNGATGKATESVKTYSNTINGLKERVSDLQDEQNKAEIGSADFRRVTRELEQAQEDLNDVTGKATDKNKELAESYRNLTNGDASVEDLTRIIAALNKEISSESDQNEIARKLEEIVALEAQLQQTENTINRLRLEAEGVDTNRTVVTPLVETGNPIRDLTETRLSPLEGAESDANLRVELDAQANEQLLDARNELNEELAALDEERQQGLRQIAEAGLSAIEDAFGAVFDSQREALELRTQTALDSINAETDARLEAAEGNAALQEQILEEQAAQQRAIEDEAARERKRIAIQEAIIGIALAVIRALPNPFAAIAAGIAGAAQLAIINSQQFKEGGMVDGTGYLDGPSHERGGIPMRVRSSGRQVELEGGEYVVPKKVVQNPAARASLRELENMRKRAGFTTRPLPFQFMEGGIVPNAAFLNRGSESEIMARAVSIAIRSVIPEMAEQVAISTGEAVKDSAPEIARQTGEAVSTGLVESNRENLAEQRRLRDSRI